MRKKGQAIGVGPKSTAAHPNSPISAVHTLCITPAVVLPWLCCYQHTDYVISLRTKIDLTENSGDGQLPKLILLMQLLLLLLLKQELSLREKRNGSSCSMDLERETQTA